MRVDTRRANESRADWLTEDVPVGLHPLVYFIGPELKCGMPCKIGTTGDIRTRLARLSASSPFPLHLHAVALGGYDREREFHRRFAQYRAHGEWFRITPSMRSLIFALRDFYQENIARLAASPRSSFVMGVAS